MLRFEAISPPQMPQKGSRIEEPAASVPRSLLYWRRLVFRGCCAIPVRQRSRWARPLEEIGNMRSLVLLAALAASMSFSGRALADKDADLDLCKFAGQFAQANESIAACDRVINNSKTSAQDRSAALSSRCGWGGTRQGR